MNVLVCIALFTLLFNVSLFADEARNPVAIIQTNQGDIHISLRPDIAPKACENFITHAKNDYYNDVTFHRVIKDFMIQGGDPTATGAGGASIWNKPFEDEFDPQVTFTGPGILAMANAGPATNGSQFFITTAATPWLNQRHTIFGEVIKGLDVVHKIENVEVNQMDKPVETQKIVAISIIE